MLSIVIPAYNEANRIGNTLEALATYFKKAEIVVSADGCTDRTERIVANVSKHHKNIRLLNSSQRLGKGGGLKRGFAATRGDIIVFADADGSCSPAQIDKLVKKASRYDVVIASRALAQSKMPVKQPIHRVFLGNIMRIFVKMLFGLPFNDTQCGYKVFRRTALVSVFPSVRCNGFEYDVELLYRLHRGGFSILEYPVTWTDKPGTTVGLSSVLRITTGLLRLRWRLLREV